MFKYYISGEWSQGRGGGMPYKTDNTYTGGERESLVKIPSWKWYLKISKSSWNLWGKSIFLYFLVLILSWFFCLSRPIPRLLLKLIFKRDQDQDMSWNKISNKTNTKTGLDLKILSRPRPILGLDIPSLEFQDQDQESRWTLASVSQCLEIETR